MTGAWVALVLVAMVGFVLAMAVRENQPMHLKCIGCGEREVVGFRTWWFYFAIADDDSGPWLHWECWDDYENQRRLDGIS